MSEDNVVTIDMTCLSSGLLGAGAYGPHAADLIGGERLLMIERRILRIEMALRRSGIEVEHLDLPE
jgi:hypothetical protein